MQTLHYLTLAILLPPLLATFTSPITLTYSGGPTTVSHLMDWREMAGRPTVSASSVLAAVPGDGEGWHKLSGAWSGGKQIGSVEEGGGGIGEGVKGAGGSAGAEEEMEVWDFGVDDKRGWMIGMGWLLACCIECVSPSYPLDHCLSQHPLKLTTSIVPLYYLIRRPTYILDFALTLNFVHLILTTYYAKAFPTSLFYWVVHTLGALFMIVVAEQVSLLPPQTSDDY